MDHITWRIALEVVKNVFLFLPQCNWHHAADVMQVCIGQLRARPCSLQEQKPERDNTNSLNRLDVPAQFGLMNWRVKKRLCLAR